MRKLLSMLMAATTMLSVLTVSASAADYSFSTEAPADYYGDTSYEEVYGSRYNYGGPNVVDYQTPELEYGVQSTTMTGIMERTILPGLQQTVTTGSYGISGGGPITVLTEAGSVPTEDSGVYLPATSVNSPSVTGPQKTAYTSVDGMERKDGSIGTLNIPSLDINMKVWEGETNTSMKRGLGHYSSTSAWDGNVGVCGHNRGAKYVIGDIKDLEKGSTITYTTIYGTRTYEVSVVKKISSTDWSYLQSTSDNRITITTCVAGDSSQRWMVQAVEKE